MLLDSPNYIRETTLEEYIFLERYMPIMVLDAIKYQKDFVYYIYGSKARQKLFSQHILYDEVERIKSEKNPEAAKKYEKVDNSDDFERAIDILFNRVWTKFRIGYNIMQFYVYTDSMIRHNKPSQLRVKNSIYDYILYYKYIHLIYYIWEYKTDYKHRVKDKINGYLNKWGVSISDESIEEIRMPEVVDILLTPAINENREYFSNPKNELYLFLDELMQHEKIVKLG